MNLSDLLGGPAFGIDSILEDSDVSHKVMTYWKQFLVQRGGNVLKSYSDIGFVAEPPLASADFADQYKQALSLFEPLPFNIEFVGGNDELVNMAYRVYNDGEAIFVPTKEDVADDSEIAQLLQMLRAELDKGADAQPVSFSRPVALNSIKPLQPVYDGSFSHPADTPLANAESLGETMARVGELPWTHALAPLNTLHALILSLREYQPDSFRSNPALRMMRYWMDTFYMVGNKYAEPFMVKSGKVILQGDLLAPKRFEILLNAAFWCASFPKHVDAILEHTRFIFSSPFINTAKFKSLVSPIKLATGVKPGSLPGDESPGIGINWKSIGWPHDPKLTGYEMYLLTDEDCKSPWYDITINPLGVPIDEIDLITELRDAVGPNIAELAKISMFGAIIDVPGAESISEDWFTAQFIIYNVNQNGGFHRMVSVADHWTTQLTANRDSDPTFKPQLKDSIENRVNQFIDWVDARVKEDPKFLITPLELRQQMVNIMTGNASGIKGGVEINFLADIPGIIDDVRKRMKFTSKRMFFLNHGKDVYLKTFIEKYLATIDNPGSIGTRNERDGKKARAIFAVATFLLEIYLGLYANRFTNDINHREYSAGNATGNVWLDAASQLIMTSRNTFFGVNMDYANFDGSQTWDIMRLAAYLPQFKILSTYNLLDTPYGAEGPEYITHRDAWEALLKPGGLLDAWFTSTSRLQEGSVFPFLASLIAVKSKPDMRYSGLFQTQVGNSFTNFGVNDIIVKMIGKVPALQKYRHVFTEILGDDSLTHFDGPLSTEDARTILGICVEIAERAGLPIKLEKTLISGDFNDYVKIAACRGHKLTRNFITLFAAEKLDTSLSRHETLSALDSKYKTSAARGMPPRLLGYLSFFSYLIGMNFRMGKSTTRETVALVKKSRRNRLALFKAGKIPQHVIQNRVLLTLYLNPLSIVLPKSSQGLEWFPAIMTSGRYLSYFRASRANKRILQKLSDVLSIPVPGLRSIAEQIYETGVDSDGRRAVAAGEEEITATLDPVRFKEASRVRMKVENISKRYTRYYYPDKGRESSISAIEGERATRQLKLVIQALDGAAVLERIITKPPDVKPLWPPFLRYVTVTFEEVEPRSSHPFAGLLHKDIRVPLSHLEPDLTSEAIELFDLVARERARGNIEGNITPVVFARMLTDPKFLSDPENLRNLMLYIGSSAQFADRVATSAFSMIRRMRFIETVSGLDTGGNVIAMFSTVLPEEVGEWQNSPETNYAVALMLQAGVALGATMSVLNSKNIIAKVEFKPQFYKLVHDIGREEERKEIQTIENEFNPHQPDILAGSSSELV